MHEEEKKQHNIFLYILLAGIVIAIISSFYFFYFKKDFDFIVETTCDPNKEQCFERDCTNPDDCPPNGLSEFKRYTLNANDFKYCQNEDCTFACESAQIKCTNVPCVEDVEMGESCSQNQ
jgi:hypothetical protein